MNFLNDLWQVWRLWKQGWGLRGIWGLWGAPGPACATLLQDCDVTHGKRGRRPRGPLSTGRQVASSAQQAPHTGAARQASAQTPAMSIRFSRAGVRFFDSDWSHFFRSPGKWQFVSVLWNAMSDCWSQVQVFYNFIMVAQELSWIFKY